jgi:hypothetical protein
MQESEILECMKAWKHTKKSEGYDTIP